MEYTAHIRENDGRVQTVSEHCAETARLAAKFSGGLNIENIMTLAAKFHDVGKMNLDFDLYIKNENDLKRGEIDHCYAGAKYLILLAKKSSDDKLNKTARFIGRIIISHHGLNDWVEENHRDYFSYRIGKSQRYDEIEKAVKELFDENETLRLLEKASCEYKNITDKIFAVCKKSKVHFSFYMGLFERLCESILVDADRTDTAKFMNNIERNEYNADDIFKQMNQNIENMNKEFRKKTDKISRCRMDISDRCKKFAEEKRKICRLTVPTGGGKTISSMRFAARYCEKYLKKKIFYIAPFMSIIEQNTNILKEIAGNDEYILEHHSNVVFENDDQKELEKYELVCQTWEKPVISTTMVQFLNTLFLGKMSSVRRFHSLKNSVIIIDEVQSIPIKCVALFDLAMNFLSEICGCTIVLCSATQPTFENTDAPILLDKESSMTGDFTKDFLNFKRTELIPCLKKKAYDHDEAAQFAYEKFKENSNLLMIVNTKKAAREIFFKIKEIIKENGDEAEVIHLSTSMCPEHRTDKLDLINKLLDEDKPVICVATQLIEAGVDISFNCVIRSLAGAQSIAQAAGRCNRHGELDISPVYVINLDENLGSLEEIKTGQQICRQAIDKFGERLFENTAMQMFFTKLYNEYKDSLEYPIKDMNINSTLLKLLSTNSDRTSLCSSKVPIAESQAFKTAGAKFEVIKEDTASVIIPYNERAKDMIAELNGKISESEKYELLRKVQKYCVSIYPESFNKMFDNGLVFELYCGGVYACNESCFDDDLGINNENMTHEVLMY